MIGVGIIHSIVTCPVLGMDRTGQSRSQLKEFEVTQIFTFYLPWPLIFSPNPILLKQYVVIQLIHCKW